MENILPREQVYELTCFRIAMVDKRHGLQVPFYLGCNSVEIILDFLIPEAYHGPTQRSKNCCLALIEKFPLFQTMAIAIDFNRKSMRYAGDVYLVARRKALKTRSDFPRGNCYLSRQSKAICYQQLLPSQFRVASSGEKCPAL